jgi:hypothetical protein
MNNRLSDDELKDLLALSQKATPAPWYVRHLDDDHAMSLTAVSTVPDTGKSERWPKFDHQEIIAATLVQEPRYVCVGDDKWEENAALIATAINVLPALIQELLELRKKAPS